MGSGIEYRNRAKCNEIDRRVNARKGREVALESLSCYFVVLNREAGGRRRRVGVGKGQLLGGMV